MKKSKLITVPMAAVLLDFAVSGFALEEIMSHKPLVYPKVSRALIKRFDKKNQENGEIKPAAKSSKLEENCRWFETAENEEIMMTNSAGIKLNGYYYPSDAPSKVIVVCCHGYTSCGKNDFGSKVKFWHDMNYNVFMVDHRCHGKSGGRWIGFGYHECSDTIEWLDLLKERFGDGVQFVLHGISMGSATVMMMSGDRRLPQNVKCTVADCGYTYCRNELKHGLNNLVHLPDFPFLYTADIINKAVNGYRFGDANPLESVKNAKVPILFIHGGSDIYVPTKMGIELYNACSSDGKELFIVPGAGHTESHRIDTIGYEKRATEFAGKYVNP